MEIKITINSCVDCKHCDYTCEFTKNGALFYCSHGDAPRDFCMRSHTKEYKDTNYFIARTYHNEDIPSWCPLKNGGKY